MMRKQTNSGLLLLRVWMILKSGFHPMQVLQAGYLKIRNPFSLMMHIMIQDLMLLLTANQDLKLTIFYVSR